MVPRHLEHRAVIEGREHRWTVVIDDAAMTGGTFGTPRQAMQCVARMFTDLARKEHPQVSGPL